MTVAFASQGDLADKSITFAELAPGIYAYTAEGDPNSGIVVGDDGVMVIDAQATPVMAADVIRRVRAVTDKPIRYVVLTHYHAVRVLGASAYGADQIVASEGTLELIAERGQQDYESEVQRFPRLFRSVESVPGLTWPTLAFGGSLTVRLGRREVRLMHVGRGHTKGDIVAWLPRERVLFAGDQVEYGAAPYCGDAYFRDWPTTLTRMLDLGAEKLVPGRGDALANAADAREAIVGTRAFLEALYAAVADSVARRATLREAFEHAHALLKPRYGNLVIFEHCMPFNVSRAYDEAAGIVHPRVWTETRDVEMWKQLHG